MINLGDPFLGVEALESGLVRKHQLRSHYSALFPGVYLARGVTPSFRQRVVAAWLWSHRGGIVAGLTAARLYGAKWLSDALPIELVWGNARRPHGIVTRTMLLGDGETVTLSGIPVTSLSRTAFDLARSRPLSSAVRYLDSLGNATHLDRAEVRQFVARHRGVRGIRQVARVLDLHDPGAQSPKETWLRMLVMNAGFPRPCTQIAVRSGARIYYLDMGWEDLMIALEYDGDHHRTERAQFARDIVRLEQLANLGWIVIRVAADTPRYEILDRLRSAWGARAASTLR